MKREDTGGIRKVNAVFSLLLYYVLNRNSYPKDAILFLSGAVAMPTLSTKLGSLLRIGACR
jgi:hypothetical protein